MRKDELIQKIKQLGKDFFSIKDLKKLFPDDAYIKSHIKRFKDMEIITPITKGIYALKSNPIDIEKVSTQIYYPSYISFESALSKYGIINQGMYKLTLATTRHSKKMSLAGIGCEYCKLKEELFFGFNLLNGVYIAEPEKALLDELYLISLRKRSSNYTEWYLDSLNRTKLRKYISKYNKSVKNLLETLFKDKI
jgi:predicted transcriptional regulator of viral defense system